MWWWDAIIEDKVRSASERGLFDNLKGTGRSQHLDEAGGEDWLGNHMLREAGLLPLWLELRTEIAAERDGVRVAYEQYWLRAEEMTRSGQLNPAILAADEEHYRRLAREINRKIDDHNMRCPSMAHELPRFPEDAIARRRQRSLRG